MTPDVIWKYTLAYGDPLRRFDIPSGATFRAARLWTTDSGSRGSEEPRTLIDVWFQVDPYAATVPVDIVVIGTGWEIPKEAEYLATVFYGRMVWHLFARAA